MNFRVEARANADIRDVFSTPVRRRWYTMIARLWALWLAGLDAIEANPRAFGLDPDAPPGWRYGFTSYPTTATSSGIR